MSMKSLNKKLDNIKVTIYDKHTDDEIEVVGTYEPAGEKWRDDYRGLYLDGDPPSATIVSATNVTTGQPYELSSDQEMKATVEIIEYAQRYLAGYGESVSSKFLSLMEADNKSVIQP